MALNCNSIVVPPANCSGHGTLVPANCTCACNAGYYNDLTVRGMGVGGEGVEMRGAIGVGLGWSQVRGSATRGATTTSR
jgi:hypothetical protein